MSFNKWTYKEDVVYMIYSKYYSAMKKEWNNAICSSMDVPRDDHTKWNMSDRERQIWYHLYMESKIWYKQTYLENRNRLIAIENKLLVTKRERDGGIN